MCTLSISAFFGTISSYTIRVRAECAHDPSQWIARVYPSPSISRYSNIYRMCTALSCADMLLSAFVIYIYICTFEMCVTHRNVHRTIVYALIQHQRCLKLSRIRECTAHRSRAGSLIPPRDCVCVCVCVCGACAATQWQSYLKRERECERLLKFGWHFSSSSLSYTGFRVLSIARRVRYMQNSTNTDVQHESLLGYLSYIYMHCI